MIDIEVPLQWTSRRLLFGVMVGGGKTESKTNGGQIIGIFDCGVSSLIKGVDVDQPIILWFIEL